MALGYVRKQVAEKESISVDFTKRLSAGETISSVQVKAFEGATDVSATIIEGIPSFSGAVVTVRVKNGADGKRYDLQFLLTASSGNIYEEDVVLVVENITS